MIRILHFVNPHLFFYKLRDEGFDKSLHEMKQKIYGTVYKKVNANEKAEKLGEIEIGDTVGVFMPLWNRWVRGQIKEVLSDGDYCVWATDYAVPVVSKPADVVKLPAIYTKMNVNIPRVYIGGLINCVPAEGTYEFELDNMVLKETALWSKKANEIVTKAIDCAIQMKFENVVEFRMMNRPEPHRFGQLTCQKPDGTWIDLTKCLSTALMTKPTTSDYFNANVYQMESVRQLEWKTDDEIPIPLTVKMVKVKHVPRPMTADDGAALSASNQSIENGTPAKSASAASNVTVGNEVAENKAKKKPNAPKSFGPFQAGPYARPIANQYPPGMMKINNGPVQLRSAGHAYPRGGFVNRCSTSRDRSYQHPGRMRAQMDQEYFESCFRKQPHPKKPSSNSSSEVDESNDESRDNMQTNDAETKQEENPNKSIENANEHESESTTNEVKNDAAAVDTSDTVPITAVASPPNKTATPPASEASVIPPATEISAKPPTEADATDVEVNKSADDNDEQKTDK